MSQRQYTVTLTEVVDHASGAGAAEPSEFIQDFVIAAFPVYQFTAAKPQADLPLGRLQRIAGVNDIPVSRRKSQRALGSCLHLVTILSNSKVGGESQLAKQQDHTSFRS